MELKTNAEIDREIVAEFVQKNLLTDEQSIYNLVRTDRNLAQRAYDWIRNTATRIFGNKQNRQRARLEHAAKIYAKALKETWGTGTTAGSVRMGSDPAAQTDTFEARTASMDEAYRRGELSEEDYDAALDAMEQDEEERLASQMGQYSFAGEKAQNADLDALETAKTMQQAGVADETIRQQTGWFMGRDGKWRWEIDDSRMQYSRRGDLGFRERNKGYDRYRTLTEKAERFMLELSDEQLTDDEAQELKELREIYSGTFRQDGRISPDALPQTKLSNYLKHDDLFEAYPQLRNATLRFANLPDGTRGQYDPSRDEIILSESLRRAPEDSLIHEVQHAIQDAEGFSGGASVEYWKEQQKHKEIAGSMTPSEQYYKTAGEIEARDTANRRTFTADERKNTPPDLGGEDTVFVEEPTIAGDFVGWTVDGNEVYQTSQNTLNLSTSDRIAKYKNDFLSSFRGRTAKFERNGHTHYARFVETTKGLGKFTYEGNSRSSPNGYKAKIRLLADGNIFELVEDSTYKNSGAETGKTIASHKNAKHWDYYVKTIVVDGKGFDVVVNVRVDVPNNGGYLAKEEYVYSILFKDNKTVATSVVSPATSKVLRQNDVATDNSLHQNDKIVNNSMEKGYSKFSVVEFAKNFSSGLVILQSLMWFHPGRKYI